MKVPSGEIELTAEISVPRLADGIVVFCHGNRNRRHGSANRAVAEALTEDGIGAAVCNLLTPAEERLDEQIAGPRFEIKQLAGRLVDVTDELLREEGTRDLQIAYFGASTAAAAALVAAATRPLVVRAVVSFGGLPNLAGAALQSVEAPTLLLVGEHDWQIMDGNREALAKIRAPKSLQVVPGGTHLFAAPGALAEASRLAREWFRHYLSLVPVTA
ncbi:MAG TPA: dienelactone hydrolase family protein [Thermoanaerobaculia bacterium]|nr:dienelactone hydrolase family protein [Thermoanaerobaculia bacterium]